MHLPFVFSLFENEFCLSIQPSPSSPLHKKCSPLYLFFSGCGHTYTWSKVGLRILVPSLLVSGGSSHLKEGPLTDWVCGVHPRLALTWILCFLLWVRCIPSSYEFPVLLLLQIRFNSPNTASFQTWTLTCYYSPFFYLFRLRLWTFPSSPAKLMLLKEERSFTGCAHTPDMSSLSTQKQNGDLTPV